MKWIVNLKKWFVDLKKWYAVQKFNKLALIRAMRFRPGNTLSKKIADRKAISTKAKLVAGAQDSKQKMPTNKARRDYADTLLIDMHPNMLKNIANHNLSDFWTKFEHGCRILRKDKAGRAILKERRAIWLDSKYEIDILTGRQKIGKIGVSNG